MSKLSLPYTFTNGSTADATQVDVNFSTIYNDYDGNIDENNLKAYAVSHVLESEMTVINLKAYPYNAKLDGSTDDAPALRSALSAIKNTGSGILFIPSGTLYLASTVTNASNAIYAELTSNVKIIGAGKNQTIIKVAAGASGKNSGFQAILGEFDSTITISNAEVCGLTFDMNGQNNLQSSGQSWYNGAVIARKAQNISVHDCEFKNCAGMQITAFGNSANTDADTIRVYNNDYHDVADTISGNVSTDHSSIYIVGNNAWVYGNKFYNASQSTKATAIECDATNSVVYDNDIQYYSIAIISASGSGYSTINQDIHDNVATNVLTGVMIYCSTEGNYEHVRIHDNQFCVIDGSIVNTAHYVIDALTNVSARIVNVEIENNKLYSNANYANLTNGYQSGIGVEAAYQLRIKNNKIFNLSGYGVYLITLAAATNINTDEIEISDNKIYDVAQKNISSYNNGISLQALTKITNVQIDRNLIENKTVNDIQNGIELQGVITGYVRDNDTIGMVTNDFKTGSLTFSSSTVVILHVTRNTGVDFTTVNCHKGSRVDVLTSGSYYGPTSYIRRFDNYFNKEYWGTAAPTSGTYSNGDRVYNTPPVSNGIEYWECISGGSPGTWIPVGRLIQQSSSAVAVSSTGTINTAGLNVSRVSPTAAVTGIILQAGTYGGQEVWVVNEAASANSVTFAATGSNVADSSSDVINGGTARKFVWNAGTSLWYKAS